MDLGRVELERRPLEDGRPVALLAAWRGPEPGLVARRGEVRAPHRLEVAGERRPNVALHRGLQAGPALGLGRGVEPRDPDGRGLGGGDGEEPLRLGDHAIRHEPGGGAPVGTPLLHDRDGVVDVPRERRIPGQQLLQPLRRVRPLELHELGEQRLRPIHLVDAGDDVHPQVVGADAELAHDPQHVVGDPLLRGEGVDRDRRELRERRLAVGAGPRPARGGDVRQAIVVAVVAVDRRGEGRLLEDHLPEAVGERVDGSGVVGRRHRVLHDGRAAGGR